MQVNLIYHTPLNLGSGYMGSLGLYEALKKNGLLYYGYDNTRGKQVLDIDKLREKPIYIVRGMLPGRMPLVARCDGQFKACWQSESYYTRHGAMDASTQAMIDTQKHFNMIFASAETDLDLYDIPTYWLPSWADTTVLDEKCKPDLEGLGFVGGREGREDFLEQDSKGIINYQRTEELDDTRHRSDEYSVLMSRFKMLVSPPGRCFNGMCGRTFEIMACKRLCFAYLNEDTMFKHKEFFRDGVDLVYFHDFAELQEKYDYYKDKPDLVAEIAQRGYEKVRCYHNQDVRARYIVECMKIEHNKWLKDQEKIPQWVNEVW